MATRELHHLAAVCTLYLCPLDIAPEVADFILVFILRMIGNTAAVTIKQKSIMHDCCFTAGFIQDYCCKIIHEYCCKIMQEYCCKIIQDYCCKIIQEFCCKMKLLQNLSRFRLSYGLEDCGYFRGSIFDFDIMVF